METVMSWWCPCIFLSKGQGGHVDSSDSGQSYSAPKYVVDISCSQGNALILVPAKQGRLQTQLWLWVCFHLILGPHICLWICNSKEDSSTSGNTKHVIYKHKLLFLIYLLINPGYNTYKAATKSKKKKIIIIFICYFWRASWLQLHLIVYRTCIGS